MSSSMNLSVGIKGFKRGGNILDIDVPEALKHRCSSGISWLDEALGGEGFAPSISMMLTGGPGCGKTTLMLQLADSLTKAGHIALFNTGEESLYQVKMVADRLNLRHGFVPGQDVMLEDLLSHAEMLRKKHPTKQIFILQDSLQTLDDGKYANGTNGSTPLRCVELLTSWAKKEVNGKFGIVIFIGQVNKDGIFVGKNGIKHAIDIHAEIYIDKDKKSETYGERLFEMPKNRFGASGKTFVLGMNRSGLYEKGNFSAMGESLEVGNIVENKSRETV